MNRQLAVFGLLSASLLDAQKTGAETGIDNIMNVKRIYVSPLAGGEQAESLRQLIITSIDSTKLFTLTENPGRADAILKGAADDTSFTDTFDSNEITSGHNSVGKSSGGSKLYSRAAGVALGEGALQEDSHHIKERKHEAYATVRLCNKDGDVLWSNTQESLGAKFRGAGADVAARIAHQLALDYERERRKAAGNAAAETAGPVK